MYPWHFINCAILDPNRNDDGPVKGEVNRKVAEIKAATRAVKIAASHGIQDLRIRSNALDLADIKDMPTWKQNGWRFPNGDTVHNAVEFSALDTAICSNNMIVEFEHVDNVDFSDNHTEVNLLDGHTRTLTRSWLINNPLTIYTFIVQFIVALLFYFRPFN